jgi:ergothioneine biosynthesis protein EgtB
MLNKVNKTQLLNNSVLIDKFVNCRKYSVDLIKNLSAEDCQSQSMEDASPAKWHLAHLTWFFEIMILKAYEKNFKFWNDQFATLFNSYYNGLGYKHPRNKRGLLTRPSLNEVLEWRKNIDQRLIKLLEKEYSPNFIWLVQLGINHEQQHQELLLTDIQHLFYNNSLFSAYESKKLKSLNKVQNFKWIEGSSGVLNVGYSGDEFHFDHEGPTHQTLIQSHALSNALVTNQEWLMFMEDGGYQNSKWWLDQGWTWVNNEKITSPLYWNSMDGKKYTQFTLNGTQALDEKRPVSNISYFEADAFARWASHTIKKYEGARLPTEFEWEVFADKKFDEVDNLFGYVWQWTSSNFNAYPGYKPWNGIAGEYNGKFMINQMVLRGSSSYTPLGHSRNTYRNFFPTHARWQMTGLRLAKDEI